MTTDKVTTSEPAAASDLTLEGVAYMDVDNEREVGLDALGGCKIRLVGPRS